MNSYAGGFGKEGPVVRRIVPTREESMLGRAKQAYVDGHLDVRELENVIVDILQGGSYNVLNIHESPFTHPQMEAIAKL